MTELSFDCVGITMPQPQDAPEEGFVACWRAGHKCPRFVAYERVEGRMRGVSYRCPCCGEHGMSSWAPIEWDMPEPPENIRAGLILGVVS